MLGAARLNGDTFKELRDDPGATLQSIALVPVTGLCYGIGITGFIFIETGISLDEAILVILLGLVSASIIALTWSATNYVLVTRLFRKTISYRSLTRPFLFSWTPGLLLTLISVPNSSISEAFRAVATGWIAISSIFAVRYASGVSIQQSMIMFILSVLILLFGLATITSLIPLFFA